jgi:hypothetical protein
MVDKHCTIIKNKELKRLQDLETAYVKKANQERDEANKKNSELKQEIYKLEKELQEAKKPDHIDIKINHRKGRSVTGYHGYGSSTYWESFGDTVETSINFSSEIKRQIYRILNRIRETYTNNLEYEMQKMHDEGTKLGEKRVADYIRTNMLKAKFGKKKVNSLLEELGV